MPCQGICKLSRTNILFAADAYKLDSAVKS